MIALAEIVKMDHLLNPFVIGRDGKSNSVGLLLFAQGPRGHHQDLVGDRGTGDVHFSAPYNNPIGFFFHHPHIHIGIVLLPGPLQPITFNVGLGTACHPVLLLESL